MVNGVLTCFLSMSFAGTVISSSVVVLSVNDVRSSTDRLFLLVFFSPGIIHHRGMHESKALYQAMLE
ncbi:hypothetical protein BDQ94DRAFT_148085 [Aspergillus welwitschiae]|uniref:Secreted protein n=1 Tax=Aspergillus welwitschiae TaxID=1341132 RepID=A0A3F3PV94_9EURO|nr:hypothetical protein BDQ94DRAFT_148085 [Aspergillus welwitschiae]RDH30851.1 hypothetical protein BDQ94DRAFT_148085 [Aspergillus welwitschiae]